MLILLILILLFCGGGLGWSYRDSYGPHIGIGTILIILLVVLLLRGRV